MSKEDILAAAAYYAAAYNRIKDNPQKILDSNGKGAEECKRVGDECAKGMKEFNRAEEALFKTVGDFLAAHENPVVAAAVRFCKASEAWIALPPKEHSSRSKDWTPEGHAVVVEYFDARQALIDVVRKSRTHRYEVSRKENPDERS